MLDTLVIIAIVLALLLARALRVTCRRRTDESRVAGDPFFCPIGDTPTLPRDWDRERAIGNYRRHLDSSDFSAWGVPGPWCDRDRQPSACALRRKEDGGRSVPSGSAVVLSFRARGRNV